MKELGKYQDNLETVIIKGADQQNQSLQNLESRLLDQIWGPSSIIKQIESDLQESVQNLQKEVTTMSMNICKLERDNR